MKIQTNVQTHGPVYGHYLVRVRAQVMSRDDSSGGWVPLGGGGLSEVSVRRRPRTQGGDHSQKPKHDYLIYGKRISDNSVVLSCTIKKDFEYNKVMPTFHHWRTGSKRFGLTFQAAADARAFDKGVRTAVEDLLDGVHISPTMPLPKCPQEPDDDVFMTLDLPQEPKDSRSSTDSNSSGKSGSADPLKAGRITYIGRDKPTEPHRQPVFEPPKGTSEYVQLQARHEYFYVENPLSQQPPLPPTWESPTVLKKSSPPLPPQPLADVFKSVIKRPQHFICVHCNEPFTRDQNKRGSCKYAPDTAQSIVNYLTCIPFINCTMYHCASDSEGDFEPNPCRCNSDEDPSYCCSRRCLCVSVCSAFCPCLWLYWPCKLFHCCGVRCGLWGTKHKATTEGA
ncbi:sprouty-related, EVH1 domain-containing protein 1 isoform X1 [Dendroctonus ponderosae]|uniref:WH1 domain-containing protein n=1 Tax=Dendroctonus ponderosae TaxID=77166 RepID=U4UVX7_DENPD|nr:sprouty-related, EVH1 domain-containing protein 1 isoform X1 [Dendroctonus ponderosae]ERL94355.1 hypothetical protein D910_11636 [Dendroctonus ponderosae]KAH1002686.1 hypothetical protein HUJ04_008751 [Dendroctonus ponderosae]KAH1008699.1 hypothetical protein HUJ05_009233 [Dendroctonus ponderosae]